MHVYILLFLKIILCCNVIGVVTITTPTRLSVNELTREVLCQQSTSTMEVTWSQFGDEESPIVRYDVIASYHP